jgi:probable phosphoglycerate mutase
MRRSYFLLRHGQSVANIAGRISSRVTDVTFDPPLTDAGAKAVEGSVTRLLADGSIDCMEVVSSPFLRARQTAAIAAGILGTDYHVDWRLRERDFGIYDRLSDKNYSIVWKNDETGTPSDDYLVEPVKSVLRRVKELIEELEESDSTDPVLLCTHGDVASIAITGLSGQDLAMHRRLGALSTAEIRRLEFR